MACEVLLASSRGLEGVVAWVASSGKLERVYRGSEGPPAAVAPVHSYLYSVRSDKEFLVHDLARADPVLRFGLPTREKFICIEISPSEEYVVACAASGRAYVWHLRSGALITSVYAHLGPIRSCSWLYDSSAFITASDDATCKSWSLAALIPRANSATPEGVLFTGHSLPVTAVTTLTGRHIAVSAGADRHICFWNAVTGSPLATVVVSSGVTAMTTSPCGNTVYAAAGSETGHVVVISVAEILSAVASGTAVVAEGLDVDIGVHVRPPTVTASEPVGNTASSVAPAGSASAAAAAARTRRTCTNQLAPHGSTITSVSVSHDGRTLVTAGTDGRIVLWALPSGRLIREVVFARTPGVVQLPHIPAGGPAEITAQFALVAARAFAVTDVGGSVVAADEADAADAAARAAAGGKKKKGKGAPGAARGGVTANASLATFIAADPHPLLRSAGGAVWESGTPEAVAASVAASALAVDPGVRTAGAVGALVGEVAAKAGGMFGVPCPVSGAPVSTGESVSNRAPVVQQEGESRRQAKKRVRAEAEAAEAEAPTATAAAPAAPAAKKGGKAAAAAPAPARGGASASMALVEQLRKKGLAAKGGA